MSSVGLDALCEGAVNHYFWCAGCKEKHAFAAIRFTGSRAEFVFSFPSGSREGDLFAIEPYDAKKHESLRVGFTPLQIYPGDALPARLLRNDLTGLAGGVIYLCPDCVAKGSLSKLEEEFIEQARSLLMKEICMLVWIGVLTPMGIPKSLRLSKKQKRLRIESIKAVIDNFRAIKPTDAPYDPKFIPILEKCLKLLEHIS
ncbi:MAG TPA: hypothetical protein PLH22_00285 [Candidatus Colwellbacteria bacterium]|nr:hypothetical protein [Candidatus Colwellbacteria bacterium]